MEEFEKKLKDAVRKFVTDNYKSPVDLDFMLIENAMRTAVCLYAETQLAELRKKLEA